jgi:ABC-type transporter Mla MlaB component
MPRLYSRPPDQATVPPTHWLVWLTPPARSIVVDASELQVMDSAGLAALLAIRSHALSAGIAFRVTAIARSSATVIESRVRPQPGTGRLGAGSRM